MARQEVRKAHGTFQLDLGEPDGRCLRFVPGPQGRDWAAITGASSRTGGTRCATERPRSGANAESPDCNNPYGEDLGHVPV